MTRAIFDTTQFSSTHLAAILATFPMIGHTVKYTHGAGQTPKEISMTALLVFRRCVEAVQRGEFIERESSKDKEFHFQNWFKKRLEAIR